MRANRLTVFYHPRQIRKIGLILLIVGAFTLGNITGYFARSAHANTNLVEPPNEFKIFWEAWQLVVDNFVDRDKVNVTEMTYGAIRGMLEGLGDQNHTVFFTPQEAIQQAQSMEGEFEGIGAYVSQEEGKFTITQPMHGSPAEEAGIIPGDVVVAVNGESIEGLSESTVISKIRGPAGSSVILSVLHPKQKKPVDLTVTRRKIEVDSVLWSQIPGSSFAYLQISQFSADTAREFHNALQEIRQSSPAVTGILLDLRNNPGGYLDEMIGVSNELLEADKVLLHERNAKGEINTIKSYGDGLARDLPMIVLVNKGSASAAEILGSALQENGRSKLVGETTTGTGTVLNSFTLSDGSVVRLGVTNWLTPGQELIKGKGVTPDVVIDQDVSVRLLDGFALETMSAAEISKSTDRQFASALLLLRLQTFNKTK